MLLKVERFVRCDGSSVMQECNCRAQENADAAVVRRSVFRRSVFRRSVFRRSVFRRSVFRRYGKAECYLAAIFHFQAVARADAVERERVAATIFILKHLLLMILLMQKERRNNQALWQ